MSTSSGRRTASAAGNARAQRPKEEAGLGNRSRVRCGALPATDAVAFGPARPDWVPAGRTISRWGHHEVQRERLATRSPEKLRHYLRLGAVSFVVTLPIFTESSGVSKHDPRQGIIPSA
jgi:hypothetical protein